MHEDLLGSPAYFTKGNGQIFAYAQLDEWGKPLTPEVFGMNYSGLDKVADYTGHTYDRVLEQYFAQARMYDPVNKRFISEDTYEGELEDPLSLHWYAYVYNNPLRYVDINGHIPTAVEAAEMASHIYSQSGDLSGGWTFVKVISGGDNMVMGVYLRVNQDHSIEYALVNKGSDTASDWKNNIQQPFGYSKDMKSSIAKSMDFVKNNKYNEITMVGHSKRGAEAVANAVANNRNAITFNPATPKLEKYGLDDRNYTGNLKNYVVTGEVLNGLLGEVSTGTTVYLPQQVFFDNNNVRTETWYNKPAVIYDTKKEQVRVAVENHSMDSVKRALKKKGYK